MPRPCSVKVKTLEHFDPALPLPRYQTPGSAGADVSVCLPCRKQLIIPAGERVLIPTGLALEIPQGYELQVRPRSGLSLKTPLFLCNSPGTIDSDYRGELQIIMGNLSDTPYTILHGERIAQIIVAPVVQASFELAGELSTTQRETQGFGHTGSMP